MVTESAGRIGPPPWELGLKEAQESGCFLEVFLVVFGFWWGPVGSRVGDPPPGVEDGVG